MNEHPQTINDLVNEALHRWMRLTGAVFDEDGNLKRKAKNCPWEPWTLSQLTTGLNESRDLDPSGLTTFMMLRGMVESYLRDIKYSAETLILSPETIESQLGPMRAVREVLENPEVVSIIAAFQKQIRDAAVHYGVPPGKHMDALEKLIEDKYDLAIIRRDALLSSRRLEAHQFTQGESDTLPPKYSPDVYEFWNVNSLLLAMRAQKFGGISVVLIRDPEQALNSYFIFAIKNKFTFTILTDIQKGPHPAYNRMSRRPDRNLERRAAQNWFPYDLIGIREVKNAEGETERLVAEVRKQIVPINVEAIPIKPIRDLEAEQFVWTILMFDLIRDRFWVKNERLPELSYTGEMVVEPQALVGAHGSLVKEGLYIPLEMPRLTREDVTAEKTAAQWEREPTAFNGWMVERYGSKVPEEVFNPVGPQAQLLLEAKADDPSFLPVTTTEAYYGIAGSRKERPHFETLSAVTFGHKEEIKKDRLWVARVNQMKAIQRFADEEFEREKDSVIAWYDAAIEKNREFLLNACAVGELMLPSWKARQMVGVGATDEEHEERGKDRRGEVQAMSQKAGDSWWKAHKSYGFHTPKHGLGKRVEEEVPSRSWRRRTRTIHYHVCAERPDVKASIFTVITVSCPEALAVICGVKVGELPWPLQHWYDDHPYHGNSILDRLDPEDWVLKNPWMPEGWRSTGLKLEVGISLSKSAYNARRKALGLPPKVVEETKKRDE